MCVLPASLWSQAPFLPGLWTHLGAFESGFMQEMCTELNGNTLFNYSYNTQTLLSGSNLFFVH